MNPLTFLGQMFSRKSALSREDILGAIAAAGDGRSAAGRDVSLTTAIQVSTMFACARVIGEGIAQVPLKLMQESADGRSRLPMKAHYLYSMLGARPNDWMTSFEYREMIAWHCVVAGQHVSYLNRDSRGRILEFVPILPQRVTVEQQRDYSLVYKVTGADGSYRTLQASDVWHVRGPSWDGFTGIKAIQVAREALGLAMVIEESQARLHRNGVRPSGAYAVEGALSEKQHTELTAWLKTQAGPENAGKPMIMDRAAKWLSQTMSGVDAQTLESRRFQIEEICRFCRVMPIMVGYSDKATTYASAEQMFIAHLVHTLAPWFQRLEQSIDANLLTDRDRATGVYANFVEEGLLRGAAKDTKDVILGYVNGGIMTPNEGRAKLDMNPDSDPASDELRIPTNIVGAVDAPGDVAVDPPSDLNAEK